MSQLTKRIVLKGTEEDEDVPMGMVIKEGEKMDEVVERMRTMAKVKDGNRNKIWIRMENTGEMVRVEDERFLRYLLKLREKKFTCC